MLRRTLCAVHRGWSCVHSRSVSQVRVASDASAAPLLLRRRCGSEETAQLRRGPAVHAQAQAQAANSTTPASTGDSCTCTSNSCRSATIKRTPPVAAACAVAAVVAHSSAGDGQRRSVPQRPHIRFACTAQARRRAGARGRVTIPLISAEPAAQRRSSCFTSPGSRSSSRRNGSASRERVAAVRCVDAVQPSACNVHRLRAQSQANTARAAQRRRPSSRCSRQRCATSCDATNAARSKTGRKRRGTGRAENTNDVVLLQR